MEPEINAILTRQKIVQHTCSRKEKSSERFFLILVVLILLIPSAVLCSGNDPWSEVFQPDGSLNPNLIDLGVTTDHPVGCRSTYLSGNRLISTLITIAIRTPSGNIVVLHPPQPCSLWP